MSDPGRQSIEDLRVFITSLSLRQTFVFSLWVLSVLLEKVADTASSPLWQWFVSTLVGDEPGSSGDSPVGGDCAHSSSDDDIEGSSGDCGPVGSLIPSLPDQVVREGIWPILANSPSVLQFLQLRRVSRRWNSFISTTPEWNAVNFVELDSSGRWRATSDGEQRLRSEIVNYRILLSEDMREVEARVRFSRLRLGTIPFYVSIEGCPPDAEESPEYYGI